MTDRFRRRLAMLRATLHHFDAHPAPWSTVPVLATEVDALRAGLAALDADALAQATADPAGLTARKTAARAHAAHLLGRLGKKARAYARKAADVGLQRLVDHSESEWLKMPEADFFTTADAALGRLKSDLALVGPFGVTDVDLATARDAVDAARPLGAQRDDARAHREVATDALDDGYTALVPVLATLDDLVDTLVDDPDFVAQYREVRAIRGD